MPNSLHLKLKYEEALIIKKDILLVEQALLKAFINIKNFNEDRKREFALKNILKRNISMMGKDLNDIETFLPTEELSFLNKKNPEEAIKRIVKQNSEEISSSRHIERQLKEIQEKLASLQ